MSNASTVNASGSFLKFSGKTLGFLLTGLILLIGGLLAREALSQEDSKLKSRDVYSNFGVGVIQSKTDYKEVFVNGKRLTNVKGVVIRFEKYYVVVYVASQEESSLYADSIGSKISSMSAFPNYKNVEVLKMIPTPSS